MQARQLYQRVLRLGTRVENSVAGRTRGIRLGASYTCVASRNHAAREAPPAPLTCRRQSAPSAGAPALWLLYLVNLGGPAACGRGCACLAPIRTSSTRCVLHRSCHYPLSRHDSLGPSDREPLSAQRLHRACPLLYTNTAKCTLVELQRQWVGIRAAIQIWSDCHIEK